MAKDLKFLRKLYRDINFGYSFVLSKSVYLKHPGETDLAKTENIYEEAYNKAVSLKIPNEKEKEEELIKDDLWPKEKEQEAILLKNDIENLKKRKKRLFIKSQIEKFNEDLKLKEDKYFALEREKESLIGLTAEKYANRKVNEFIIMDSFYIDTKLKDKINLDNFEYTEELTEWIIIYNEIASQFSLDNIKKIALSPMFLNNFMLCDNDIYKFYGKPIIELSNFQVDLCVYGKYFANIFAIPESEELDDNIKSDPDALSDWYKAFVNFRNNKKGSNSNGKGMSFLMGANQKDINYLNTKNNKNKDLNAIAQSKGGKLDINDLAKI